MLTYIHQHLDEPLSLNELAQVACFSPYHFHRVFRGMVGESLGEHVRRLRLERAASRLKGSRQSITALAFEAGYETLESFSRAFAAMFGQSPSNFRRLHGLLSSRANPSGVHFGLDGAAGFRPLRTGGERWKFEWRRRLRCASPSYVMSDRSRGLAKPGAG